MRAVSRSRARARTRVGTVGMPKTVVGAAAVYWAALGCFIPTVAHLYRAGFDTMAFAAVLWGLSGAVHVAVLLLLRSVLRRLLSTGPLLGLIAVVATLLSAAGIGWLFTASLYPWLSRYWATPI